ncbi:Superfamilies 1 and 2 helicase C-terminal domain protein [Acididesulfobacillus acetoxydans]|uniref:Superfamilies 1 and 2 helicase C-terminal domain protein n=1 Tax=Acididesulfobacillus acetoxydans TaxID=1561005 RepID=A0A8S0XY09_9FIRM|nr:DEAD/DEAH box helicase [Acididesulfobacillus acetoxydans]CAA7602017.1 Superfamilies 1 and 2 helicase C-terminal domain protein [Acididesulfobacillus acetoxydans]CEJ08140.1 TATA-binding protein-associated factor MOT1 [Acididesulfobacillus acetoxydans]
MPSLNIPDNIIFALASSRKAYEEGIAHYRAQTVRNFTFTPSTGEILAAVKDAFLYSVKVSLGHDGSIMSYGCNCLSYSDHTGACRHIVAVLKTAQKQLASQAPAPALQNRMVTELLASLANPREDIPRETVQVEVELDIPPRSIGTVRLQLRLGLRRLYLVKDFREFLTCVHKGKTLEFGRSFTYDPARHTFKPEDQKIITMLQEMWEQHIALVEMQGPYYTTTLFSQKMLPLRGYYLGKFLDALGDKVFQLATDSFPKQSTRINRSELPLEFALTPQNQSLALALKTEELPLQLTADGSFYLYRQQIYRVPVLQQETLPALLNALRQAPRSKLVVPPGQKESFASEALPLINRTGKLVVDSKLAGKFHQEDLVVKIYFDRPEDNGITARLEFHYGGKVINPFASAASGRTAGDEDFILIRAVEQERKILGILEQAAFTVSQGMIHLSDDDDGLFDFTLNCLPQLRDLADIYYSDEFKLKIRSATTFTGRVRLDENLDLLEVSFQYNDIAQDELADIFSSLRLKKKYHRLRDGSFLDLNQPELASVALLLDNLDLKPTDLHKQVLSLPKYRAMYIDSFLRQANLPGIQRNKAFKQLVQSILEPQDGEFEVPQPLRRTLREYQVTGFKWLKTLASFGLGGILADDMGLGKTLQVLSFILDQKGAQADPALVVAPTSLIYNWQQEAAKFVPDLKVLVIDGTPRERAAQLAGSGQQDLIVTSYPLLRRDIDKFAHLEFSYCFLDEAQHIKNPQTLNAKSVQRLQAKGYFVLTGTPIENSLSELWSLFNFVMPGYLLSHQEFRKKYEIPIVKGENPEPLSELSRHVNPFILRRLKKDVLRELPEKIETQLHASLTEPQKKIYLAYLQEARRDIAREIAAVGFEKSHIKILAALTRLRQICCHPAMFVEHYNGESGKMQLFREILGDALDSGHRILVFSQFTSMLEIIQDHLNTEKIEHFYLNGSTKAADRAQMAQAFNAGSGRVFLISLKAGGTGLNLTGADMVIHFDPWWNPAVEDQATDRAHRIGQTHAVQVIKLLTQGTVEEKVNALQAKKKALINAVIQPGETMLSKLSEQELRGLFDPI